MGRGTGKGERNINRARESRGRKKKIGSPLFSLLRTVYAFAVFCEGRWPQVMRNRRGKVARSHARVWWGLELHLEKVSPTKKCHM